MKKFISILVLCSMLSSCNAHKSPAATEIDPLAPAKVMFADASFEGVVRASIAKPSGDIYENELTGIIVLDISGLNISDLAGIEYLKNLKVLFAWDNNISTLSRLSGLSKLEDLYIMNNQISDLSPLAGVTSLRNLAIYGNSIISVTDLVTNANNNGIGSRQSDNIDLSLNPLSAQALADCAVIESKNTPVVNVNTTQLTYVDIKVILNNTGAVHTFRRYISYSDTFNLQADSITGIDSGFSGINLVYGAYLGDYVIWDGTDLNGAIVHTDYSTMYLIAKNDGGTFYFNKKAGAVINRVDYDTSLCVLGTYSCQFAY